VLTLLGAPLPPLPALFYSRFAKRENLIPEIRPAGFLYLLSSSWRRGLMCETLPSYSIIDLISILNMSIDVKKACILNSCLLASIGMNGLQGIGSLEKLKLSLLPEPIKEF
jgi:hypothetical protein